MAGYSGTPLPKKLGISDGTRVYVAGAPASFSDLLEPWPAGAILVERIDARTDIVHLFDKNRASLDKSIRAALKKLKPDGVIWVSWPKKASKIPTDITEDTIRDIALPLGLVDIKVCAIDETWSGLKLVIRKENRESRG